MIRSRTSFATACGVLLGLVAGASTVAEARTFLVLCDFGATIQSRIDQASPGDTIIVAGICSENVRLYKDGITLQAAQSAGASIAGPDAALPTIRVTGARVTISGFSSLSGGSHVIRVGRGGSVVIESNDIGPAGSATGNGVLVTENSYARVGGSSASLGNSIHDNHRGVGVSMGSGADIFFNTISNNDRGINVTGNGAADVADNSISGSDRGLNLFTGGTAQISSEIGTTGGPNTFANNATAIRCRLGGSGSGGATPVGQIDGGGNGTLLDISGCHVSSSIFFDPLAP